VTRVGREPAAGRADRSGAGDAETDVRRARTGRRSGRDTPGRDAGRDASNVLTPRFQGGPEPTQWEPV